MKKIMKKLTWAAVTAAIVGGVASTAGARDYISIVGSSTVYPFATTVAERFGKATKFKTPKIESTGTGGGMKLFCAGIGEQSPDINDASRRIKKSEFEQCRQHGVKEIVEVKIGYDGIVFANSISSPQMKISRRQLYLALAKEVPDPNGAKHLVPNPYSKWSDLDSALPEVKIEVFGPPPTSGTRDAFDELVMEAGARSFPWLSAMEKGDKKRFTRKAQTIREDGAYIEAGENDNLIIQKLTATPNAFGIFGFSFLDQNRDKIQGAVIDGEAPTFEAISAGDYVVSRPLFFYVKKAHVGRIPGLREYIEMFASDKTWGPDGYLADKGLIPMPDQERAAAARTARLLIPLVK